MYQVQEETKGILIEQEKRIPFVVRYAGKLLLYIKIAQNYLSLSRQYSQVEINYYNEALDLGPCELIFEDQNQEYNGIICFTKNIYDFELLFSKKKHNFEISSNNIDLVLNQKYLIKPSFAQHVASLTYDLSVYKQFFSGLDNEIKQEKPDYKKKIEKYIINNEGKKFLNFFDLTIQDLEREVADYTKVEHNTHGFYLRRQVWDIIQTSAFLNRTNTRPRGYAGDSRILYMIYQNKFKGNGIFAKLMHKHPLETVAAKAVRNRKQIVSNYIRQEYQKHKLFDKSSFKFMSIACGPAIELKNIFSSKDEIQKMECKLLDQDTLALTEAKSLIAGLEKKHNSKLNVEYIQDSVRTLICNPNLKNMLGQFHVIYSLGLFDYLTPPTARKVIRQLYDLLLPGGSLLIGNFHINNPTIIYMEYWGDWVLYYRTEKEFLDLISGLKGANGTVFMDKVAPSQMYLKVIKEV